MDDSTPEKMAPSGQFVQALARGLSAMRAFDAGHQRMRLSEVASRAGLTRAVARRSLLTLASLGYVRIDDPFFELTPKVLEFGYSYMSGQSLGRLARPFLEDLSKKTGESTSLSVLSGTDVLYVDRVHRHSIIRIDITVGTKFPAIVTSMGRVMLAAMPDDELDAILENVTLQPLTSHTITDKDALRRELELTRERGWAYVDQEFEVGLRSIAAPVRNATGETIASINVSLRVTDKDRTPTQLVDRFVPMLVTTANDIGRAVSLAG
jgi:IclR family pca regulon transcriptional regulator